MVEVSLLLEATGLQAFAKAQGLVGPGSGVGASGNGVEGRETLCRFGVLLKSSSQAITRQSPAS